jgi:hypothetical protein
MAGPAASTAAFFDLDKTIIAKSSALAFSKPFQAGGLISRRSVLRSAYAQFVFLTGGADHDQMEKMRAFMSQLVAGWDVATVREIVADTLHGVIDPLVYDEATDRYVPAAKKVPAAKRPAKKVAPAATESSGPPTGGTTANSSAGGGSPGKSPTKVTCSDCSCRPISRAMSSPQALPRSAEVPFGTSSWHGISLRTLPRSRANFWIRSSSSGTPGAMRSIGTRRGREGGHRLALPQ